MTAGRAHPQAPHPHAPVVADRRGLTALGAVSVALVLGLAGATVDVVTGPGLRLVFAVCFVVGCVLAALLVHQEDLKAAVLMPPLVYVVLAFIGGALDPVGGSGSFLRQQALEMTNALVLGAPVLLTATGLALLVAGVRVIAARNRSRG
jgi:hypothetical protein